MIRMVLSNTLAPTRHFRDLPLSHNIISPAAVLTSGIREGLWLSPAWGVYRRPHEKLQKRFHFDLLSAPFVAPLNYVGQQQPWFNSQ